MARKPATKKDTPVTDTTASATGPAAAPVAPAATTAPATAPIPAADPAPAGGVAWGENPAPNSEVDFGLLRVIVDATNANSFVYKGTDETAALVAAGFAEVNPGMVDDFGAVATRATAQGISKMAEQTAPAADPNASPAPAVAAAPATDTAAAAAPASSDYAIFSVPLPTKTRASSGRTSSYPFDKLEVGQSFFVANTAEKPDAKKSMASTVSSATRRFATAKMNPDNTPVTRKMKVAGVEKDVPVFDNTRVFELFSGKGDAYGKPGVDGAIVARTK